LRLPQPHSSMPMDSYPGRPSPPSPLNGGLTLSTTGPSAHDFGPFDPLSDRPELYRAHHKGRRYCLTRPDNPRIVPDHPIHSQTVRLHRSDHPKHQKSPVIRLVWKAGINIVGHPTPSRTIWPRARTVWTARRKGATSAGRSWTVRPRAADRPRPRNEHRRQLGDPTTRREPPRRPPRRAEPKVLLITRRT
jgi:hypothetical protein